MTIRKRPNTSDIPVVEYDVAEGDYDSSRLPVDTIVLHTEDGFKTGTRQRFDDPTSHVSAHYGVNQDGSIDGYCDEDVTAYHAGNYLINQRSIGIEHEDFAKPNDPRPDALYNASIKLVANICKYYGFPADHNHIKLHREVSQLGTACPDTLDTERIINGAAILLLTPVPPVVPTPNINDPLVSDPKSVRDMLVGKASNYDGIFTYIQTCYPVADSQRFTYDNGDFVVDRIKQIQTAYQLRQDAATKQTDTATQTPVIPTPEISTVAPVSTPQIVPNVVQPMNMPLNQPIVQPVPTVAFYNRDLGELFNAIFHKWWATI